MQDEWGIPEDTFGPVQDDFYAALGRVSMLAAFLDERMLDLRVALAFEMRSRKAGTFAAQLVTLCEDVAEDFPEPLRSDIFLLCFEARAVHMERNEIVHSVYPNATLESAFAWRSVGPKLREKKGQPTKTFTTNRSAIQDVITRQLDLLSRLHGAPMRVGLIQRAHNETSRRVRDDPSYHHPLVPTEPQERAPHVSHVLDRAVDDEHEVDRGQSAGGVE